MKKPLEHPLPVLLAYEAIERLLLPPDERPLYSSNKLSSELLLYILHDLFDKKLEIMATEAKPSEMLITPMDYENLAEAFRKADFIFPANNT